MITRIIPPTESMEYHCNKCIFAITLSVKAEYIAIKTNALSNSTWYSHPPPPPPALAPSGRAGLPRRVKCIDDACQIMP
ncbi:MAG: hypothetical protein Q6353_023260 [Candidatus Sigynarchaeum springense]